MRVGAQGMPGLTSMPRVAPDVQISCLLVSHPLSHDEEPQRLKAGSVARRIRNPSRASPSNPQRFLLR